MVTCPPNEFGHRYYKSRADLGLMRLSMDNAFISNKLDA
jgi:hypothetical protein